MKDIILKAQKREANEKAKTLRNSKLIPGIIYGKGKENNSIKVNDSDMLKIYKKAGSSTIISIDLEGNKIDVLIHDIQRNPVNGNFLHIDFYAITLGQTVTANIKLNFIGKSSAEKEGAIIEEHIREIEVSVLPRNLVDSIDVDISTLEKIGDNIRIKDLNIDRSKFELSNNEDELVVIASEPKKVVEEKIEETEGEEVNNEDKGEKENKE